MRDPKSIVESARLAFLLVACACWRRREWSEEQELALVKALKVVSKAVEDRWGGVAELVPGKTKAQCFKRFKEMKDAHKAKKAG